MVKNLPAVQGTWVRSLGQENPLEKGMATHSRILAWEILWTEEPASLQFYNQVTHMISQACYVFLCFPYILFITWNVLHCFKIFGLFSGQICGAFLKCLNRIDLIHPSSTSFMFCYSTQRPLNTHS